MSDDILSDEDKALFRRVVQKVNPLEKSNKIVLKKTPTCKAFEPPPPKKSPQPEPTLHLSNHYQETVNPNTILCHSKPGLPKKRLNQLKEGRIPWQARLDLHGLSPDEARNALCHFIDEHYHLKHRCIFIIHGKGGRHGEEPILKNLTNHWLQQLPEILAFHSAVPRDGGSGALYVLLKRCR